MKNTKMSRRYNRTKAVSTFAWFGLGLVVLVSAFSYRSSLKYRESNAWRIHSEEIILRINEMQSLIERAETAQRGFVLTENDRFLAPFDSAVSGAIALSLEIQSLASDNSKQTAHAKAIEELLRQKISSLQIPIGLVRSGQSKRAILTIRKGEGQTLMDELRKETESFKQAEGTLLRQRSSQADRDFESAALLTLIGLLGTVAVLATVTFLLQREISQRTKMAEKLILAEAKANQNSDIKSQFLANMSHEIRTPLNGIIGMTKLLSATKLNEEQTLLINPLQDSAHFLLSLINQVLDLSKIESGKLQLEDIHFELRSLVESTKSMLMEMALSKKIALSIDIGSDVPDQYLGDPLRVRQILLNLLSNAIKFSQTGTITVNVRSLINQVSESVLEISVQDEGLGMTGEVCSRLFQSFSQGDGSTTRRFGGTGLGLSISRQLVELMGGTIRAESVPGVGSKFTFTVILKQAKYTAEYHHSTQSNDNKILNASILVAEDNLINQKVIAAMLSNIGCRTIIANNGLEALEALKTTQSFDLILMDGQMPLLDGYETTRSIRSGRAGDSRRNIPIIAVTANAIKGDNERCLEVGMNDYIPKPISQNDLFAKIQKWLRTGSNSIDLEVLERLRKLESKDNPNLTNEIITLFLTSAPNEIATLRKAKSACDLDMLRNAAHSFRSSCANVGAIRMQEIASRLEKISRVEDLEIAEGLLSALENEFLQVSTALRGYNAA